MVLARTEVEMLHDEPIRLRKPASRPASFAMSRDDARRQLNLSLALVGLLALATLIAAAQALLTIG